MPELILVTSGRPPGVDRTHRGGPTYRLHVDANGLPRPRRHYLASSARTQSPYGVRQRSVGALIQIKMMIKARLNEKGVAAFPGPRRRHFQKQRSNKEELKRSSSRAQVELKYRDSQASKFGGFRGPHWKCRNRGNSVREFESRQLRHHLW
jgi:hypothetical protein